MPMPYYFNIPFPNHSGLVELQEYLRSKLPEGTTFVDPAQFHMTLVYVMEGEGIEDVATPENLPVFGVGGSFLDVLRPDQSGETPYAVTVGVEKIPALVYLQSALFYAVRSTGAAVSTFSWPGLWRPHVTVAYAREEPDVYMVPNTIHLQVDRFELTTNDYEVVKSYGLQTVRADGTAIAEMAMLRDTLVVGEFKGGYPDVPTYADVDLAALTKGDDDPFFVTLPVAKDNAVSENKRQYNMAFVNELVRQMREKRPTGIQGHIPDKDRATLFPTPRVYWVGDAKVGDITWGKAYVVAGETRDMVRHLMSVKGKLGTSLYGPAEQTWNTEKKVWEVQAEGFVLEHIDLAPPDRMGIPALAAVPKVTSEMADAKNGAPTGKSTGGSKQTVNKTNETTQEGSDMPDGTNTQTAPPPVVDRTKIIREMTVDDAAILPRVVQEAVLEKAPEKKIVSEIRGALQADEGADLVKAVQALVKEIGELRAEGIVAEIQAQVTEKVLPKAPETDKVKAMRQTVIDLVAAHNPDNKAAVAEMVDKEIAKDHIKVQIEGTIIGEMGPNQRRPGETPASGDSATGMMQPKPVVADDAK